MTGASDAMHVIVARRATNLKLWAELTALVDKPDIISLAIAREPAKAKMILAKIADNDQAVVDATRKLIES